LSPREKNLALAAAIFWYTSVALLAWAVLAGSEAGLIGGQRNCARDEDRNSREKYQPLEFPHAILLLSMVIHFIE
jgi:hypothetical protein